MGSDQRQGFKGATAVAKGMGKVRLQDMVIEGLTSGIRGSRATGHQDGGPGDRPLTEMGKGGGHAVYES